MLRECMPIVSCLLFFVLQLFIAMGPADPYTTTASSTSTTNGTNAPIPVTENSQSNTSDAPAPAKWLQPKNDAEMETDNVGLVAHNRGYKHILFFLCFTFYPCRSCCYESANFALCLQSLTFMITEQLGTVRRTIWWQQVASSTYACSSGRGKNKGW